MTCSVENILSCINEDKKLKELIHGKRVCLCGPASTNKGTGYGDYINGFDTVCRINWHLTGNDSWDDDLICDFGSKTDVMFSGNLMKFQWKPILNRKKPKSPFNCFKDLKYVYIVDAIFNKFYWDCKRKDRGDRYVCHYSNISSHNKIMKGLNIDYGVINTHLVDDNGRFIKEFAKTKKQLNVFTNSGVHAIEAILKHKPKTLFITGMNFGNFGKGELIKNLYVDKGNSRRHYENRSKTASKRVTIHTGQYTIMLLRKIFDEYKSVKLDNLLKDFFEPKNG